MAKYYARERAIELRKQGLSIPKIAKAVSASKSSVSRWVAKVLLSSEQLDRLKSKNLIRIGTERKAEKQARHTRFNNEGRGLVGELSDHELLLIGAALYWGEGHKTLNGTVGLSNSDPALVCVFIRWLTESLRVPIEDIKASLNIHEDMDEIQACNFWERVTGIPQSRFYKTQIAKNTTPGIKKKKEYCGTITILVHDINLQFKIEGMLNQISACGETVSRNSSKV